MIFFAYRFPSIYMLRSVLGKLGCLQNKGTSLWNFVPNSGLEKIWPRHGKPTVGECDINSNSGRSGVDSTWRRRGTRGECGLQWTTDRRQLIDWTRSSVYSAMVDLTCMYRHRHMRELSPVYLIPYQLRMYATKVRTSEAGMNRVCG